MSMLIAYLRALRRAGVARSVKSVMQSVKSVTQSVKRVTQSVKSVVKSVTHSVQAWRGACIGMHSVYMEKMLVTCQFKS